MREPRREDPAESFGPYLIYECLGRGGMATVHRAKQTGIEGFERPVALKRMLPWLTSDPEFVKSFVREARLAALLRHTHIVQTYDLGKVDAVYYIAMELVAGHDVRELLRHAHNVVGPPPPPVTISLLFQVCDALDYAHNFRDDQGRTLGLVHRDISPANVIIADDGTAKIVDFGVAKGATATLATMSGMLKGKFAYMAPEMLQGQIDARCDLFAVGVVAWELMTARPLFAGGDDMEILQRVTTWDPPPPSSINPAIPRELDAWAAMALAKDPKRRFQNAAQMRAGLELVARTPSMRASQADVSAWITWAFAQKQGVQPSPAPQIPAPLPAMPMPMPMPAPMAATVIPPAPAAPIGGADSVSVTIDDATNPRLAPPIAARHTPQLGPQHLPPPAPQVIASSPGASSAARTMMLDGPPPAMPPRSVGPEVGVSTLPGTGQPIKPMPPPGLAARAANAAGKTASPNLHATMMGTGVPAAVAAAAAQMRGSVTAPPAPISPGTVPPPSGPAPAASARTVMFEGAPPSALAPRAGGLPAMPPGASADPPAPPQQGYPPYPPAPGYPHPGYPQPGQPMQGYPGAPMPAAMPAPMAGPPGAPPWGAGTPGGHHGAPMHHGGPTGGMMPHPGGSPVFAGGPGMPGHEVPMPRPSGSNSLMIVVVLLLLAGAAVGGYFLVQHFA